MDKPGTLLGSVSSSLVTLVASQLLSQRKQNTAPMPRIRARNASVLTRTRFQKKKRSTRGRTSFATMSRRMKPTKHWSDNANITTMTHDTIYSYSPSQGIDQGVTNSTRLGDSIYLTGLRLKGFNITDTLAAGYSVRILVGWTGEEYAAGTGFINTGLVHSELFLPDTGTTWNATAIVNPKAFTLLHDQTVTMNSLLAGVADLNSFDISVPITAKMVYQSNQSTQGKLRNLYVIVIGNVVGGTGGDTDTGDFFMSSDLTFKDSN